MKKLVSSVTFISSIVLFLWVSNYTKSSFDYDTAQFVGYIFYWCVTLFLVSLCAMILEYKKYKIWLLLSGLYVFLTIIFAYIAGNGNGMILSFDGKLLTWLFAGMYASISLIYFIVQFVKSRR
jgi:hypothetical protein